MKRTPVESRKAKSAIAKRIEIGSEPNTMPLPAEPSYGHIRVIHSCRFFESQKICVATAGWVGCACEFDASPRRKTMMPHKIDLSGIAALQNVGQGTNVTFRIVNYGGTSSGGTWYIFDVANSTASDFAVQGVVTQVSTNVIPVAPILSMLTFTNHQSPVHGHRQHRN